MRARPRTPGDGWSRRLAQAQRQFATRPASSCPGPGHPRLGAMRRPRLGPYNLLGKVLRRPSALLLHAFARLLYARRRWSSGCPEARVVKRSIGGHSTGQPSSPAAARHVHLRDHASPMDLAASAASSVGLSTSGTRGRATWRRVHGGCSTPRARRVEPRSRCSAHYREKLPIIASSASTRSSWSDIRPGAGRRLVLRYPGLMTTIGSPRVGIGPLLGAKLEPSSTVS